MPQIMPHARRADATNQAFTKESRQESAVSQPTNQPTNQPVGRPAREPESQRAISMLCHVGKQPKHCDNPGLYTGESEPCDQSDRHLAGAGSNLIMSC